MAKLIILSHSCKKLNNFILLPPLFNDRDSLFLSIVHPKYADEVEAFCCEFGGQTDFWQFEFGGQTHFWQFEFGGQVDFSHFEFGGQVDCELY